MKRAKPVIFAVFFIILLSLTTVAANDIELVVKKVEKVSDDEFSVQYYVINRKNFDRYNVTIGFKIFDDGVPVGCKRIKTTIPKDSDESDIKEAKIKISGEGKNLDFKANIFYLTKQYRVDEWFSDCPDSE